MEIRLLLKSTNLVHIYIQTCTSTKEKRRFAFLCCSFLFIPFFGFNASNFPQRPRWSAVSVPCLQGQKKKKKKKALQALVPLFAKLCELLVWLGGGSHRHDGQGTIHKAFVCRHETGARCPWSPEALQASGLEVLDIQF